MSPSGSAARLRGVASGLLTATLALAAHGYGGAEPPTGAAVVALAIIALTVGTSTATLSGASKVFVLLAVLTCGQIVGHIVLGASGHDHTPQTATMVAAHALAVGVGAVLIAAGDRLCGAVSRVVLLAVRVVCLPRAPHARPIVRRAEQPLRSALLLAASVSHRGPPVSPAC
ncbi:hypothetical protein AU198_00075 [Mycobacterium sp. GA-1199]|uniref:hypothetical protein n=1 Tax=Mycobacterium sp. GA-1199 TaxID=1772287 RepID=UPI00074AD47C|nr:hypothetical protein [Mycobacterium sp. GA-1199]KUI45982.1 hypothetical protein AU198_00075 [Mycobacterium sp. GA-1199]